MTLTAISDFYSIHVIFIISSFLKFKDMLFRLGKFYMIPNKINIIHAF